MEKTKAKEFVSEKISEGRSGLQFVSVLKAVLSLLGGFLLSNPFVLGEAAPFAVSLTASSGGGCLFWCAAGNIIGALAFFDGADSVKYGAAALFCVLIKSLFEKYVNKDFYELFSALSAFGGLLFTELAIILSTGFRAEEAVSAVSEAVLGGAGAFVFLKGQELLWGQRKLSVFTDRDTAVMALCFAMILMSFYKYTFMDFSVVRMLFAAAVLFAGRVKNPLSGAVCGICMSSAAGLSGEEGISYLTFSMGGLLSGSTAGKSRFLSVLGYMIPAVIFVTADAGSSYMILAESAVACLIYSVVPEKAMVYISEQMNSSVPVFIKGEFSSAVSKKIKAASYAVAEVSECVDTVSRSLAPMAGPESVQILKNAWERVCGECELKESCRKKIKNPEEQLLKKLTEALHDKGRIDNSDFPEGFSAECYMFEEMKTELKRAYENYKAYLAAESRISRIQGIMTDQFRSMADILKEIACDFDDGMRVTPGIAEACVQEAEKTGLEVTGAESHTDKFGRTFLSLEFLPPRENFNVTRLTENISCAAGMPFELPELTEDGDICTLSFRRKKLFDVEIGAVSRPADGEKICGDYYSSFMDADGRFTALLSDGMGTGTRAAVDSAMTAELFMKLIKSGISPDCALPIVNSALLAKSSDESLATLDAVCFDLYTGRADFLKAGAAASFIRHKGSAVKLEEASLPIGILRDVSFVKAKATLHKGDIILIVSDGIIGENSGWIQQELKLWDTEKSADELASFIVSEAAERISETRRDDMTAVVVYIT